MYKKFLNKRKRVKLIELEREREREREYTHIYQVFHGLFTLNGEKGNPNDFIKWIDLI